VQGRQQKNFRAEWATEKRPKNSTFIICTMYENQGGTTHMIQCRRGWGAAASSPRNILGQNLADLDKFERNLVKSD